MARNFTARITFDRQTAVVVVLPALRRNGMHYEVNIPGFPRFWMRWGATDRYELKPQEGLQLPDALVLAVSDAIEEELRRRS